MWYLHLAHASTIETQTWHGADYTVVVTAPEHVRLVGQGRPLRTLSAALEGVPGAKVAMNAGMFHADRSPVGLHVEAGRRFAPVVRGPMPGNFGLQPNGVFAIDSTGARVVPTSNWRDAQVRLATQSGPMLVVDGALHPAFRADSPNRHIRNGVGVRDDGAVVFAISSEPVRFHDLATLFRDALGCPNALYLDGAVSALAVVGEPAGPQAYSGVLVVTAASRRRAASDP